MIQLFPLSQLSPLYSPLLESSFIRRVCRCPMTFLQCSHRLGEEIDSHDIVIRFNSAPTRGFAAHAGKCATVSLAPCREGHRPPWKASCVSSFHNVNCTRPDPPPPIPTHPPTRRKTTHRIITSTSWAFREDDSERLLSHVRAPSALSVWLRTRELDPSAGVTPFHPEFAAHVSDLFGTPHVRHGGCPRGCPPTHA